MNKIANFIMYIQEILWKIKDYDRLAEDYSQLLWYTTNGNMSKTHYRWDDIEIEVDKAQSNRWYWFLKEDIQDLDTKKEILEYISKL